TVQRDSGAPSPVVLGTPFYQAGSGLQIPWTYAESGERPVRLALLRSETLFATAGEATWQGVWTNANPLVTVPPSDGRWYYAMIGRDAAGNVSPLSNLVTNDYDSTSPAFSITYDKASPCGVGPLYLTILSSEALTNTPTVTVQPPAATAPTMLTVSNTAPNRYLGRFNVQASSGSGPLTVKVSGSDLSGNRTVSVSPAGAQMVLDTRAPAGVLSLIPSGLIQVTNPVPLEVSLTLDELPAETPVLTFTPPEGAPLTVGLTGGQTNWSGVVELLPTMGSGHAAFALMVSDLLGNSGAELTGTTTVELYNTELPEPPPQVAELRASTDQAGGLIKLAWSAATGAEAYALYRQAGLSGTTPDFLVVSNLVATAYDDVPPEDGFYRYAAVSSRRGSSAQPSPAALGLSDRTPPPAPQNLTASLASSGVRVAWEYPTTGEQPNKFRVYRNGSLLRDSVGVSVRFIIDNPATGCWSYAVAAVDLNGNEALSDAAGIDLSLAAVSRTDVTVGTNGIPRLTWQARSEHVGVNVYRNGVRLNAVPLPGTTFSDTGLSGETLARYEVRGVNAAGEESAGRQVPVYHLAFGLAINPEVEGVPLLRYFDQGVLTVSNRTSDAACEITQFALTRSIADGETLTRSVAATQTVEPGACGTLAVTLPCAVTSGKQSFTTVVTQVSDDPDASVSYLYAAPGTTPSLALSQIDIVLDEQPLAGAACAPKARIYNRSQTAIDLVMWRNGDPGDLSVSVLDAQQTEVSRIDVSMAKAALIPTADGLRGFLRIPAKGSTLLTLPEITIPEALGESETAYLAVTVARIYSACGETSEDLSGPLAGRYAMTPKLTAYTAFGQPERAVYFAGETLVVTGYAYDRVSSARMPGAAVRAGIAWEGATW
ncbi:MAG: hypothetical protein GX748_10595, partial [Lentisphaerae bacterium]|nr:hypothetical protein [Lentisphaerota bacterium]